MTIPPASLAMATQQPQSLLPAQDKQAIVADGPIDGFGAQMPLDQAVHWIVPPGLSVTFDGVADRNLHVDWRGGTSWRQTLSDALAPVGLVANFTPQGVSITPPPPPPPPWRQPNRWHADKGDNLANVVRNWGQSIGISPVVHGDYSYPMEAPITIDGDFVEAVSQLTEAFSTAEPRPLVDFWIDGENFAVELTLGGRQ